MRTDRAMRCMLLAAAVCMLGAVTVQALSCNVQATADCGYVGINQAQCEDQGCCWQESTTAGTPWCFRGETEVPQWTVANVTETEVGIVVNVQLANPGAGSYGPAINELLVTVHYDSTDRVRVRITDPNNERYEIPTDLFPPPYRAVRAAPASELPYTVVVPKTGESFSLQVVRNADGTVLFDLVDLEYSDQFLQLRTLLPEAGSPYLYGLGEHRMNFLLPTNNHSFTLWNQDSATPWDQNIYGSHPFYLQVLAKSQGTSHGVFLRNSNGMDTIVTPNDITFKVIGGILDFYVFMGPTPEEVVQQYQDVIGTPHFTPYWSLGWHQCKWGWKSIAEVEAVVAAYAENQIPLDTIWADIDYMDQYHDFTWDPVNYPVAEVAAFTEKLHANGQHYVVIVDPGIRNLTGYAPYDQGLEMDIFIKTGDGVTPVIGQVWPGFTAFPDFLHPNATEYWTNQIQAFLKQVPYDGLWIDMNEISSFFSGVAYDPDLAINNPPYAINNVNRHAPLAYNTLPMDALHYDDLTEYNVHNVYSLSEAIATHTALESIQQVRSFVLSRSTFPSSGMHTAHWLGDNHANWYDLWRSIPGMLNMNMYGVPMVGADICGFIGNTTEELCARWTALGAFSPFSRNHHEDASASQEPYLWPSVMAVAKKVLAAKYSLLPSLYTQMYTISVQGGTALRSMMFNFPTDVTTYSIDTQFMWGDFLLVTPVLTEGATSVTGYFPTSAVWYDYWTLQVLPPTSNGVQTLSCSIEDAIRVHIRGGSILFTQAPEMTTTETRLNSFDLIVAFDATGSASGNLFWDNGNDIYPADNGLYITLAASLSTGQLNSEIEAFGSETIPPIGSVQMLGVTSKPSSVTVQGSVLPQASWSFDATKQILTINTSIDVTQQFTISWTGDAQAESEEPRLATE